MFVQSKDIEWKVYIKSLWRTTQMSLTAVVWKVFHESSPLLLAPPVLCNSLSVFPCSFTSSKNVDYGAFLVSVNGLSGNDQDRTYWELLIKGANKVLITADVGRCVRVCIRFIFYLAMKHKPWIMCVLQASAVTFLKPMRRLYWIIQSGRQRSPLWITSSLFHAENRILETIINNQLIHLMPIIKTTGLWHKSCLSLD